MFREQQKQSEQQNDNKDKDAKTKIDAGGTSKRSGDSYAEANIKRQKKITTDIERGIFDPVNYIWDVRKKLLYMAR